MVKATWKGGKLLLALADFLENDPRVKGHFEMDYAVVQGASRKPGKKDVPDLAACGSAACALGWAPYVPAIAKARVLRWDFNPAGFPRWVVSLADSDQEGGDVGAIGAAAFGISEEDGAHLFGESRDGHRTPKQVARNIRRFVKAAAKRRGVTL